MRVAGDKPVSELARTYGAGSSQQASVRALARIYEARGVVSDGRGLPLDRTCSRCTTCWRHEDPEARPPDENGEIALPWVGSSYAESRIVVVAMNLRGYGGLFAQWDLYHGLREHLGPRRRYKGSDFAYGVGAYVRAVSTALSGGGVDCSMPSPDQSADAWQRCALLEAVKCSPFRGRSEPNSEMWASCPAEFLAAELKALDPLSLVVLGVPTRHAVRAVLTSTVWERRESVQRGFVEIGGNHVPTYAVHHTAYYGWRRSYTALCEWLRNDQARAIHGTGS